jgi:hypothetical protein
MSPRDDLDIFKTRKSLTCAGAQTVAHPACLLVSILTMLSQLIKYLAAWN